MHVSHVQCALDSAVIRLLLRQSGNLLKWSEGAVDTIECKTNPDRFDARNLAVFRASYAQGDNYVVSRDR